ncbi:MAG TPA: AI-2E family transporter [Myxococcota bacterium]|nr:AI-2E family transporter [Myxococcota bacterium]
MQLQDGLYRPAPHPRPETARSGVPRTFLFLMLSAVLAMGYIAWPFRGPLFLAIVLAVTVRPLYVRLIRALRGREHAAATLMTLAVLAVLVAPLASIAAFAVSEVTQGIAWLRDVLGFTSWRDLSFTHLPPEAEAFVDRTLDTLRLTRADFEGYANTALGYVQTATPYLLNMSVNIGMDACVMLLAFFFLCVDGPGVARTLITLSPLQRPQTEELLTELRNVSSAALIGSAVTALLQGLVVALGFVFCSIPHAVFFGLITLIAAFVPVIGSALVWLPACVGLALTGRVGAGIALAAWCAVLVFITDHAVKPLVLRGRVEMHMGLVFLGLLGGISMLGLIGIIAGPLVVAVFLALLRMYQRDYLVHPVDVSLT